MIVYSPENDEMFNDSSVPASGARSAVRDGSHEELAGCCCLPPFIMGPLMGPFVAGVR